MNAQVFFTLFQLFPQQLHGAAFQPRYLHLGHMHHSSAALLGHAVIIAVSYTHLTLPR